MFLHISMLDRSVAPGFNTDFSISLEPQICEVLNNEIELFVLSSETIEVFRLDLVYPFGMLNAPNVETGNFLVRILTLGTAKLKSLQVAESFEKLGGFLDVSLGNFKTTVTLHGLSKYLIDYIPLLKEVIYNAIFPESEIEVQKNQAVQSYLVNSKKTSFVANKWFKEAMYGSVSLLGKSLEKENIEQLSRKELVKFHSETIQKLPFHIYLCGKFSEDQLGYVKRTLGEIEVRENKTFAEFPEKQPPVTVNAEMEDSIQSTLILGKRLFSRNHQDFHGFLVTNTILGGYFGSRLMKNIREEKGLTYGVSSSLISNTVDGVFSIKADLNKVKLNDALSEIEKEIEILKSVPVEMEELKTVKNYIKGNILNGTNTIFDIMDKYKAIKNEKLPEDFYNTLSMKIDEVNPDEIMHMAQMYLKDFSVITAG